MPYSRRITALVAVFTMAAGLAVGATASPASGAASAKPSGVLVTPIDAALSVSWSGALGSATINGFQVTVRRTRQPTLTCLAQNPTTSCYLGGRLLNGKRYGVTVQPGMVTAGPHFTLNFTAVGKASRRITAIPTTVQNCSYIGQSANLQGCDLSNRDLSSAVLSQADLAGTNLTDTNLDGASLAGANMHGALLTGTNLTAASFNLTDLSGDVLTGLELSGAVFNNTDLAGFDLAGADMSDVLMYGNDLTGTDLAGVDLVGGSIAASSLVDADLAHASVDDGALVGDNLTGANFAGATVTGVNWANSTCPDGTSASSDGGSCANNLG